MDRRYHKALEFIYSRQLFGTKLGLDNIWRLTEGLGFPQDKYDSVHVAGTNGKGSTSSFIASILQQSGYKVGLTTSPHLADFRERIRINGRKISYEAVSKFIEQHQKLILRAQATFFKVVTAMAFWHFEQEKVDWAVLETGLGGRLDATNVVRPEIAVITNISLEHTNILGRTRRQIAVEKGGIIKAGVPLVAGVEKSDREVARCLEEICARRKAPLSWRREGDFEYRYANRKDFIVVKRGPFAGLKGVLSLPGKHQAENASLAVRAAALLRGQGFHIDKDAVRRGLKRCYWPARFMTVRKKPRVIIDVAHNLAGFEALTATLVQRYPGRRFDFLIGMVELKRGDKCLEMISSLARSFSVVPLINERRDDPYHLISRLDFGICRVRVFPTAAEAYKVLLENSLPADILIVAGSHFLIDELAFQIKRDGF